MKSQNYIPRLLPIAQELKKHSILLLGPRRTGKSSLIQHEIKPDQSYNLLHYDVFQKLSHRPHLIRESLTDLSKLIVIDEIQKLPQLMDEVHAMIESSSVRFLLTGSSARKLKRTHTSLMAGRAKMRRLYPFSFAELKSFSLKKALSTGLIPTVYLADDPWEELIDYVSLYLREEIQAEALSRNIENFSRFLHTAALSHTELLNFESVARDAQVPARTIREYYSVLEDTLIGTLLPPYQLNKKRKTVSHSKFYFFDIGVVHQLIGRKSLPEGSDEYGRAFEHFIFHELQTYLSYHKKQEPLTYWRTQSGFEVDFIVGDSLAVEVKSTTLAHENHCVGLKALAEEKKIKHLILVSRDSHPRRIGQIEVYPYSLFLEKLWAGELC